MAWVYDRFGFRKWVADPSSPQTDVAATAPDASQFMAAQTEFAGNVGGYGTRQKSYKKESMFGDIYRNALSGSTGNQFGEDVPKGSPSFAGGSPLQGRYAERVPMAPWSQAQAPSGYGAVRPKRKLFEGYKPWSLMG